MKSTKLGGGVGFVPVAGSPAPPAVGQVGAPALPAEGQGALGSISWEGTPTAADSAPKPGQTTLARLEAKGFARKNHELLGAELAALMATWPKDTAPGVTPEAFERQAKMMDAYKAELLTLLQSGRNPALAAQVVGDANVLHGKPGHAESVAVFARALLAAPAVSAALGLEGPSARIEAADRLEKAAPWLNLCDLEIPTAILCAPRRLSEDELAQYVKPRAERSADRLQGLGFAAPEVVALVRAHRGGGDRPLLAQLLDLADQAAAMAAKPFFRKDGHPDGEKLAAALGANAEKAGLDGALVKAVVERVRQGALGGPEAKVRAQDLWLA